MAAGGGGRAPGAGLEVDRYITVWAPSRRDAGQSATRPRPDPTRPDPSDRHPTRP